MVDKTIIACFVDKINTTEERITAAFELFVIGEVLGKIHQVYKKKLTSFDFTSAIVDKVSKFIHNGGLVSFPINNDRINKWISSSGAWECAIMNDMVIETLKASNSHDDFCNKFVEKLVILHNHLIKFPTIELLDSWLVNNINKFDKIKDFNEFIPYYSQGGYTYGACARAQGFGLYLYGKKNRSKLIKYTIDSSRLTHNNAFGFLSALAHALFIAYALENIGITTWPFKFLELIDNPLFDEKYVNDLKLSKEYIHDKFEFITKWKTYLEDKFDKDKNIILNPSKTNIVYRNKYYYDTLIKSFIQIKTGHGSYLTSRESMVGYRGDDAIIVAYDGLVDADKNWEKLIFYTMLYIGNTSSTGAIAAGLFGAMYGLNYIPETVMPLFHMPDI